MLSEKKPLAVYYIQWQTICQNVRLVILISSLPFVYLLLAQHFVSESWQWYVYSLFVNWRWTLFSVLQYGQLDISWCLLLQQGEIAERLSRTSKPDITIWPDDLLVEAFSLKCQVLTILHHTGKDLGEGNYQWARPILFMPEVRCYFEWIGLHCATLTMAECNCQSFIIL